MTYFGPDRSAVGWVWLLALAWSLVVALAMFRPLVPPRARVSEEEMKRYDGWVDAHPRRVVGAQAEQLLAPAQRVSRFSFRY